MIDYYKELTHNKDSLTQLLEAGRVLSTQNEQRLRNAVAEIQAILEKLDQAQPAQEDEQREAIEQAAEAEASGAEATELVETITFDQNLDLTEARQEVPLKILAPGWGHSGYYGEDVLRHSASAYQPGTLMFLDHQTESAKAERPEGSMKDLAGVLVEEGHYNANGPEGPGIYSKAKLFSDHAENIQEKAPWTGLSHRAYGGKTMGEAEGKQGPIVQDISYVESVDIVTKPAAGGKLLLESEGNQEKEGQEMPENLEEAKRENQQLKEAIAFRDAKDVIVQELSQNEQLPQVTKNRLTESVAKQFELTEDGKLDQDKLKEKLQEAVKAETDYVAQLTGSGQVRGINSEGSLTESQTTDPQKLEQDLTESFKRIGLPESVAKEAAQGRG